MAKNFFFFDKFPRNYSFSINLKFLLGIIALISFFSFVFRPPTLSWDRALLAIMIIWVGMSPGIYFLFLPAKKRSPFPFMPLVGLSYAIFFGVSIFSEGFLRKNHFLERVNCYENDRSINLQFAPYTDCVNVDSGTEGFIRFIGSGYLKEVSIEAQFLVICGLVLMFMFWFLAKYFLNKLIPAFSLPRDYPRWRLCFLSWLLILTNIVYIHFPQTHFIPSVGQFIQPAGYLGFAIMLGTYYENKRLTAQLCIYFFLAFPLWTLGLLTNGFLTPLILVFALWGSIVTYFNQRVPWQTILILSILFIGAYTPMVSFRSFTWAQDKNASFTEKLAKIPSAILNIENRPNHSLFGLNIGLLRRSGLIFSFSYIVEKTPEIVPYWNGETYKPVLVSWVPRIIWPNKPAFATGRSFGERYSLLRPNEPGGTSLNLPWITELYANFGRVGVILGMASFGLFFGFLDCFFNRRYKNVLQFAVGSTLLVPFIFTESNFALMTGSFFPLAISLWLYFTIGLRFRSKM